jgi:hypothetical protein
MVTDQWSRDKRRIVGWSAGVLATLVVAGILALAGTLSGHEGRITRLEANDQNNTELLKEIRQDIKDLLKGE